MNRQYNTTTSASAGAAQVDAVVAMIQEKGTGLYALVNNAGVGGGGNVVDTPIEDQSFVYAVNAALAGDTDLE